MEMLKTYYTQKYIFVYKPWLSYLYKILQISILIYVICFNIIYKKGYQAVDYFSGSVTTKVKGVGIDSLGNFVDAYDLVHPAQESNSLFIATRRSITRGQYISSCPGHDKEGNPPASRNELCNDDNTCPTGVHTVNGITTGKCIINPYNNTENYCEIHGWCPLENENYIDLIQDVGNFTVFIRTDGYFPNFLPQHRLSTFSSGELIWNYNLFYLSDIIAASMSILDNPLPSPTNLSSPPNRLPTTDFESIMETGAVVMIDVLYNCNLDNSINECQPSFKLSRVDMPNNQSASGFNFRESNLYYINSTDTVKKENMRRDLNKYYGVKILFSVHGEGRRYDFLVLSITIGSGIGLLGIASYLCDVLLTSCVRDKYLINNRKYEFVPTSEIKQPIVLDTSPIATLETDF